MYLTHHEGKYITAERFIRTLKNKIYEYMTSVSKSVYIDNLDDIVKKYSNSYYSTTKIKLPDVKSSACIDSSKEIDEKSPKVKIGDTVRISKSKNIFAKSYLLYWSEQVFLIKKVKNIVPWTCY